MKILLTAVGKRIQLIKHLKREFKVIGTDCSSLVAAVNFVDEFYEVPRYNEKDYVDKLIEICMKEKVKLIIPLFEKEFLLLDENRKKFSDIGVMLLLSEKPVIEAFNDKINTYKFFKKNQISTPATYSKEDILAKLYKLDENDYPYIIKPVDGMGSSQVFKAEDEKELKFFLDYVKNPIAQKFAKGTEYTIDAFCDADGTVISVVPRIRLDVRSGEVVKTRTVKHNKIIDETIKLCSKTKFVGPVTIQCMVNEEAEGDKQISFIEVNPRLGGGVPATFESGVDYYIFIKALAEGVKLEPIIGKFKEITMLRYDEAVIL